MTPESPESPGSPESPESPEPRESHEPRGVGRISPPWRATRPSSRSRRRRGRCLPRIPSPS
ncbi:hypothetical protein FOB72_00865 [Cupriavidus pauculus]|uniref:Uncharacterized protein n=1 Tax=Cupriavidus pauculus TaxID=82633 RepID=A0A5P2GZH8_9BURK|nr:hypothetical protein FOB72_00865 [Cupriavidus pauculus]